MTEVKFFYNVDEKLHFACKLARRAVEDSRKLVVYTADQALAEQLDVLLWKFAPLSFVPHVRAGHALATETPVVIAHDETGLVHHGALLNLGVEPPAFFSRFEQLREIVTGDKSDKEAARVRARFYESRGFKVNYHDIARAG